jgi:hypothetical protein
MHTTRISKPIRAEKSKRLFDLYTLPPALFQTERTPLVHGSSISRTGYEERGIVGVFVRPENSEGRHLLTAGHALDGEPGSTVQQVSHLDVLQALTKVFKEESDLAECKTAEVAAKRRSYICSVRRWQVWRRQVSEGEQVHCLDEEFGDRDRRIQTLRQ